MKAAATEPIIVQRSFIACRDAALDAHINAALALKQEKTTGSLEAGKRADPIVPDRDIFALDPFELHTTRGLRLDGREVCHQSEEGKP